MVEILNNDKEISLGQYLKKVRGEKLITVEEIASVTKISLNLLTALENDVQAELPAPPFVKGFIKSYARYVGVDPKIALGIYEQTKPIISGDNQPIDKLSERKGISLDRLRMSKYSYLMITVVLIFSLTVFSLLIIKGLKSGGTEYTGNGNSTMVVNIKNSNEVNSSSVKTNEKVDLVENSSQEQVSQMTPMSQVDKVVADTTVTTVLSDKKEPEKVEEQTIEQKILSQSLLDKEQIVDIMAKDNVWVKVQTDDTAPFDFLLKTGQTKIIKAQKEIKMMFGDAGAVSLKYNGRIIETLGEKGSVRTLVFPSFGRWKGATNLQ